MLRTKMDQSYRVDEGYSEDPRSEGDPESPMGMESGQDELISGHPTFGAGLLEAALGLGESEKSGRLSQLFYCEDTRVGSDWTKNLRTVF